MTDLPTRLRAHRLRGDRPDLLTDAEHQVVELLAKAMKIYAADVVAHRSTRGQDLNEFAAHIHDLQNTVLAQAAARAYPDLYRLAGGTFADKRPSP